MFIKRISTFLGEQTEIVCEKSYHEFPQSKEIKCFSNEVIHVKNANYGRTATNICGTSSTTTCYSTNSFDIVSNNCEGKQTCTIEANNSIFGDPCFGIEKYLEVVYQCVQGIY